MALVRVIRGQTAEAQAYFRHRDGSIIVGMGDPVTWVIRDWDNNLIISGNALQDIVDPSLWTADIIIPTNAPIPTNLGQRYQILWELPLDEGSVSVIERFEVVPGGDPINYVKTSDVLAVRNKPLQDTLMLPDEIVPDSLNYQVQDLMGTTILEEDSTGSQADRVVNGVYLYDFQSNEEQTTAISNQFGGIMPFVGSWEYQLPNESTSYEFHSIYVIDIRIIAFIQQLRQMVDRANMRDIHEFLTFTDADLMHHLVRGLSYINAHPPIQTNYTFIDLPHQLHDLLLVASAMRALQAQYLAEGMTTFDFQGLGVQLSTERTQYIQTLADNYNSDLQDRLRPVKRGLTRASGPGILAISVTPITGFSINVDTSFYQFHGLYRSVPFGILGY